MLKTCTKYGPPLPGGDHTHRECAVQISSGGLRRAASMDRNQWPMSFQNAFCSALPNHNGAMDRWCASSR